MEQARINCKTVSKILVDEKMSIVDGKLLQIDNSLFPSVSRWIAGDDRKRIIQFIEWNMNAIVKHVDQIFDRIKSMLHNDLAMIRLEEDVELLLSIIQDLNGMAFGFKNMKQTYHKDATIVSTIDTLEQNRAKLVQHIIKRLVLYITKGIQNTVSSNSLNTATTHNVNSINPTNIVNNSAYTANTNNGSATTAVQTIVN